MVVHLNIHTAYDLLQSTVRIAEVVSRAAQDHQTALAITDTNVMFGVQSFYHACKAASIKPIIGMTVYVSDGLNEVETVLLAKNKTGYGNLMKLSSKLQLKSLSKTPMTMLEQYEEGNIVIFKNLPADMNLELSHNRYVSHDSPKETDRKVYIHSVKYITTDGDADLKVLQAIDNNEKLTLETLSISTGDAYFRTQQEIEDSGLEQQHIDMTEHIAAECDVDLDQPLKELPKFKTPDGQSSDDYLWQLIQQGKSKVKDFDECYEERLLHEYQVIQSMQFSDYFLIVGDLVRYAKSKGILVGPGRGSSGGSLISYLLGITMIDPIEHDLFFERFLNPERVTMPDIDIDFEDTRREEVIEYCVNTYGSFNVSGIVTFGHLSARAVMRDVGRILQFKEEELKLSSHLLPKKLGLTLSEAYEEQAFYDFVHQDARHEKWYRIAERLEGLPRHTSTHAAGVIIHDHLLTDYVPLMKGDQMNLTQWTMTEVERIGLLKIDFLGLRNLSIIQRILKQSDTQISTATVDYADSRVYEQLSLADTTGIFQLESSGIRQVLRTLKPQNFEDIVAVLSLYRPGPMEQIPLYIRRRHGEPVEYLHPDLESILSRTYGVIIYQEQIMQIANQFAGFTLGEADNLRRAMSKKKRDVLEAERIHFIEGSLKNGYDEETAKAIYDLILKFADYGFPRAHAVAYAQIAYLMMYLKVRYPAYFYASIMSNVMGSEDKLAEMIAELKEKHIQYDLPSINRSNWYFTASGDKIILSLGMIKGVGYRTVMEIVKERRNGKFKDIYDFCQRMPGRIVSRASLEALILVGAFDEFQETRATLLASLDDILNVGKEHEGDSFLEELGLNLKKTYRRHPEMSDEQKSTYEVEHLGFFLTTHPIERLFMNHLYLPIYQIRKAEKGQWMLGSITSVRTIRTKKGQPMAFLKVMDGVNELELVVFPTVFQQVERQLSKDQPIVFKGKFDKDPNKLIVEQLERFETFKENHLQQVKEIYVLKKPEQSLEPGEIKLFLYDMAGGESELLSQVNLATAKLLLAHYPPEMIRII